jgi:hypothetical protein
VTRKVVGVFAVRFVRRFTKELIEAQQLFYLPFVKSVYIWKFHVDWKRYNIVEWDDVKMLLLNK